MQTAYRRIIKKVASNSRTCNIHCRLHKNDGALRSSIGVCAAGSSRSLTYSSYDYPLAKEAPEITRTTAQEAASSPLAAKSKGKVYGRGGGSSNSSPLLQAVSTSNIDSTTPSSSSSTLTPTLPADPFDDSQSMSDEEREKARQAQRQSISTSLAGSTPISSQKPSHIPSNLPYSALDTPHTMLTQLDNGIRVVSQDLLTQVSTIGVVSRVGSRHERPHETGVTNLLEVMAFGDTEKYDGLQITQLLQDWGGIRFVNTGREQALHCVDLLRPNVPKAMELLLSQVLLKPRYSLEQVQNASQALQFAALDLPGELLLSEAMHEAAFGQGGNQQLGQPHFATPEQLALLTPEIVQNYWESQFVCNPQGLVVAGAGVEHDRLVELADKYLGHLQQDNDRIVSVKDSVYQGGQATRHHSDPDGFIRVGIAFPVGGWSSSDLVPACVLQTLLGGGSSFSAGGPGKGMYSRLYRQVLNRYHWVEAAEAMTAFAVETGLWGVSGAAMPHKARELTHVLAQHLHQLANEPVSDEELHRARNMLKNNVLTQLESRLVLFEDLGRQVLTYGHREDMHTTCHKIEAVTAEDLQALAKKAIQHAPTVASVGEQCQNVPSQSEVASWFSL